MLLITPAEVIAAAFTSREQITPASIRPLKIDIAQEHYIRPRFGDQFFEKMLSNQYGDFVDEYIKPALSQYVRYGVIDELSVQMSDTGAIIYGSTDTLIEKNESGDQKQNLTQSIVDETISDSVEMHEGSEIGNSSKTEQLNVEKYINNSVPSNLNENSSTEAMDRTDDTTTTSGKVSVSDNGQNTRTNTSLTATDRSGKTTENRGARSLRVATIAERHVIAARALSDANILLAKAVRYVERNSEQFTHYLPTTASSRIFF